MASGLKGSWSKSESVNYKTIVMLAERMTPHSQQKELWKS